MKPVIPIFFSVGDADVPYLAVALTSIVENASRDFCYRIHVLDRGIGEEDRRKLSRFDSEDFHLEFLSTGDRPWLFVPALFPQYEKGIYLDCDLIVPGDISALYRERMGDKLVGAVADYSGRQIQYVDAGVLLLNMKRLREVDMEGQIPYLSILYKDDIHYLDPDWNAMPSEGVSEFDDPQIIHFTSDFKPWLNEWVPFSDLFWHYARRSGFYARIGRSWNRCLQHPDSSFASITARSTNKRMKLCS